MRVPPTGSRVEIEGMVRGDQTFISEIEYEEGKREGIKIKGIFGGTSPDGAVWYIGGIAINMPLNIIPPPEGRQIELKGIVRNGVFTVIEMETKDEDEEEVKEEKRGKVEIDGVLVGIDRSKNVILVEVARARLTVDISAAQIEGEDEQPLSLSDLESLVGEEVEIIGSYREDGSLNAKKVSVDVEWEGENDEAEKGERVDGEHEEDEDDEKD